VATEDVYNALIRINVEGAGAVGETRALMDQIAQTIASVGAASGQVRMGDALLRDFQRADLTLAELGQRLRAFHAEASKPTGAGGMNADLERSLQLLNLLQSKMHQIGNFQAVATAKDPEIAMANARAFAASQATLFPPALQPDSAQSLRLLTADNRVAAASEKLSAASERAANARSRMAALEERAASIARSREIVDDPRTFFARGGRATTEERSEYFAQGGGGRWAREVDAYDKEVASAKRELEAATKAEAAAARGHGEATLARSSAQESVDKQLATATHREVQAAGQKAEVAAKQATQLEAESALRDSKKFKDTFGDREAFLASIGVEEVQTAQGRLSADIKILEKKHRELMALERTVATEEQRAAVEGKRLTLEKNLEAKQAALRKQEWIDNGRGGFMGGLMGNHFGGGEGGVKLADLSYQAGQATKYFALYSALSMAQRSVTELVRISAEYSRAVSELSVAMGTSVGEAGKVATGFAAIGAELGTSPMIAIESGSKFARTFRTEDQQVDPEAGRIGARLGSLINVLDGTDRVEKVLQDSIALAKAQGSGAYGASMAYDQAAYIGRQYGFKPGELLGGAAAIGDLGRESGYNQQQLLALVGGAMAQTGTTSEAVAGDLKRVLGNSTSPQMQAVFQNLGIDMELTLREKFEKLAERIEKMTPQQRSRTLGEIGDPRTNAIVAAMIADVPNARKVAAEAEGKGTGAAEQQAQQNLKAFGGELQKLSANLTNTGMALANLGLIQFLTHLVQAGGALAKVLGAIAAAISKIPGAAVFLEAAAAIGLMAAASKALSATKGAVAATEFGKALSANMASSGTAATTLSGRIGGLGKALGSTVGPALALTAALWGISEVSNEIDKRKRQKETGKDADKALGSLDEVLASGDPTKMREALNRLQTDRKAIGQVGSGAWGLIGPYLDWSSVLAPGLGSAMTVASVIKPEEYDRPDIFAGYKRGAREQILDSGEKRLAEALAEAERPKSASELVSAQKVFGRDYDLVSEGIAQIKNAGLGAGQSTDLFKAIAENGSLFELFSPVSGKAGVDELAKHIQQQIGRSLDPMVKEAQSKALAEAAQELATRAQGTPQADSALQLLEQANGAYIDVMVSNTEARIASLKSLNKDSPAIRAKITEEIHKALEAAAAAGDVGAVVKLLSGVDKAFLSTYKSILQAQMKVLKSGLEALQAAAQAAAIQAEYAREIRSGELEGKAAPSAEARGAASNHAVSAQQGAISSLQKIISTIEAAVPQTNFTGSSFEWPNGGKGGAGEGPSPVDIELARLAAQERPGDPQSAATTALNIANYQLKNAKNKQEYWQAYKALNEAKYQLAQVELQNTSVLEQLKIDLTDPVATAQQKVREAQRQLAFNRRRGASSVVINENQLQLKQAQQSAASAAWQQQFTDNQTNYELQRMSLGAYMNYLNGQKAYLNAVHKKSREQIEQLNQVERALKGLTDGMSGQWNLGEIRIPSPYEMRRNIAGSMAPQTTVHINIAGTDLPAIKGVLSDYLGQGVMMAAGTLPPRV
jgi:hypothetical protein